MPLTEESIHLTAENVALGELVSDIMYGRLRILQVIVEHISIWQREVGLDMLS